MSYTIETHQKAVATISSLISNFHTHQQPFRIYHGSTNSTRQTQFDSAKMIDTSNLTHCLHIDPLNKRALVEPNVPMDALVAFTLKHNLPSSCRSGVPGYHSRWCILRDRRRIVFLSVRLLRQDYHLDRNRSRKRDHNEGFRD